MILCDFAENSDVEGCNNRLMLEFEIGLRGARNEPNLFCS